MTSHQINKYRQSALTNILGWMIHDIWTFIDKESFPEELDKQKHKFKSRLLEINDIGEELRKLRTVNFESFMYSNLLDADTSLMLKKVQQLNTINIKHLKVAQIKECYGNDIMIEEDIWLEKIEPFISNKSPRFIEHKLNKSLSDWYKKNLHLLTFFDQASSRQIWNAFAALVGISIFLINLIDDQMNELHYLEFFGQDLSRDGFDLNDRDTKKYLAYQFNMATDHLRSIKDYLLTLIDGYEKVSTLEFMERITNIEKLFERWHAVGVVSAQESLRIVNQNPYPRIEFFTLKQQIIDRFKKPKNWYVDLEQKVFS